MGEQGGIARAAAVVAAGTLVSRVLGFLRDVVVAAAFGAGLQADAFFVAFRIPNLLRRLVGEGALSPAIVPVLTESLLHPTRDEARAVARALVSLTTLGLLGLALAGVAAAPVVVRVIAPGFAAVAEKLELTILLTRIMFPYIFFIGLVAMSMGILNAFRHFAAPAFSPALLNVALIASVLWLAPRLDEPVLALAIGVLLGGVAQLAAQIPALRTLRLALRPTFRFGHPALRRIGRLMAPSILGLAIVQLNIFISTLLASFLPQGSISYLYYADRVVELPLGVFAVALGTAVLPTLSEQAARRDLAGLRETVTFSLRLTTFVAVPAMVGLGVLSGPIIHVLFERGEFGSAAVAGTAHALLFYAVGLWGFSAIRVLVPAFYALQEPRAPVMASLVALVVNAGASLLLMGPLRHAGLALATSIAAAVNLLVLLLLLRRRLGGLGLRAVISSGAKVLLASGIMGGVVATIAGPGSWQGAVHWGEVLRLGAAIVGGAGIFLGVCAVLRAPELAALQGALRRRLRRRGEVMGDVQTE